MLNPGNQILDRLARADRQHQKEVGGCLLLRSLKWLFAALILAFVADVLWHLNAPWRLSLGLVWLGGGFLLLCLAAYLAWVRQNRPERTARFLEERNPSLGSKLINFLQLQHQTRDTSLPELTRTLAARAVEQYAHDLRGMPLEELARTPEPKQQLKRAAWACLAFLVLLALFPRITAIELARFADPFGDHPPFSLTRLELVTPGPSGTNVIYGRSCLVEVKAHGHRPKELFLTAHPPEHPEQAVTLPMFRKADARYHQQLENIRTELVVYAHTRRRTALSKQGHIGLILTPQLDGAWVEIQWPEYTHLKPQEKAYKFQPLQALHGSRLRFRLKSNRPLRSGTVEYTTAGETPKRIPLEPVSEHEVAGAVTAEHSGRLRFALVDVDGITSQASWEGGLTVTYDVGPQVRIAEPASDSLVAMDFNVTARIEASDDYGLQAIRVHRALNGLYGPPKQIALTNATRTAAVKVPFDIPSLGVEPGDVISLFAEAVDNAPEPHLARSGAVHLLLISVEDYQDLLREQTDIIDLENRYAELLDKLNRAAEQQTRLEKEAAELQKRLSEATGEERQALDKAFTDLLERQRQLDDQIAGLADEMERFVGEQPLYDVERELQERLREQAKALRESQSANRQVMDQLAQAMAAAQQAGQPGVTSPRVESFRQAAARQARQLGATSEQTQEQVVEPLANLAPLQELMKDFNLFEALYRRQEELTSQARAYDRQGTLDRMDQLALKELAAQQNEIEQQLRALEKKLRQDAKAAQEKFPKAARSGRDLADAIQQRRLPPLAQDATRAMLAAQGSQAYQSAERLRSEMEKLFCECNSQGNRPNSNELDQYLRLQKGLNPGRTFAQMFRSRNFNFGGSRSGPSGRGQQGQMGYVLATGRSLELLGRQSAWVQAAAQRRAAQSGRGLAQLQETGSGGSAEQVDTIEGITALNRQSGSVASEAVPDEYSDVVENYFKALTTQSPP